MRAKCEECDGSGDVLVELNSGKEGHLPCPECLGKGAHEVSAQVDPENLCMFDGCENVASHFEERIDHWHDFVWCNEHAKGKTTVPLKEEVKS